jgi:hypothetical protein
MGGKCSTYGGDVKCIYIFYGKPEKERPLGKHRPRCNKYIIMGLQEAGRDVMTGLNRITVELSGRLW